MSNSTALPLVLIVEDETPIRRFLGASLIESGYRINEAATAREAAGLALDPVPDLIILDLGLPDDDGQNLLLQLRQWYRGPLLVLSARDQEQQKIRALDNGADDYVTKPFSTGELLARIRGLLRRKAETSTENQLIEFGKVQISLVNRTVKRAGVDVHLTPLEYKLLTTLVKQPEKVLTHRYLLREVWGPHDSAEPHYVRVFIASLRRKLEDQAAQPRFFITEPGIGYRFLPHGGASEV